MPYVGNEGPDQPAHSRRLIRAFDARFQNHKLLRNRSNREGPDDTANAQADLGLRGSHIEQEFCSCVADDFEQTG